MAEKGRNQPEVYSFPACDENGDGWIDLAVAAADDSPDKNTILNTLWVFSGTDVPSKAELVAGQSARAPLAHVDCGNDSELNQPTRHDLALIRLRNTGASEERVAPALTIESMSQIALDAFRRRVLVGAGTTLACSVAIVGMEKGAGRAVLRFPEAVIPPHGERVLSFVVVRGPDAGDLSVTLKHGRVVTAQGRTVLGKSASALRPP